MEQRTLRLGDTVDDYCPRERRITNHVIVALVVDAIRQTRCSTCDAEHPFKGAKAPRPRKHDDPMTDLSGGQLVAPRAASLPPAAAELDNDEPTDTQVSVGLPPPRAPQVPPAASVRVASAPPAATPAPQTSKEPGDAWVSHRPLIRASLPRTEGELPPPRVIPEFTMHQRPPSRRDGFRPWQGRGPGGGGPSHGHSHGNGEPNGNVAPGAGRPGRPHVRPSQGEPGGEGSGGGHSRRHRGGKSRRPR